MTHRLLNSYKKVRDNDLISFAHGVAVEMEGNPNFSTPSAALAAVKKELPAYQEAIIKARGGDEEMRFIRKDKRALVIALLTELADYVTLTCNGDPAMLVSSGFELNKGRGARALATIKQLKVTIDRPGEAATQVKRVTGAKAYIHQYTPDPLGGENVWISKGTTDPSYTFTGLKSKEKYWFQVIAIGLNGQEEASPPVSRVIQ